MDDARSRALSPTEPITLSYIFYGTIHCHIIIYHIHVPKLPRKLRGQCSGREPLGQGKGDRIGEFEATKKQTQKQGEEKASKTYS